MKKYTDDERIIIQATVDWFKENFPFFINGKQLEVPIFQGGMGVDISTDKLAKAVAQAGGAGTISTTMSRYIEEYRKLDLSDRELIIGLNNLVKANDYEDSFALGDQIKSDFMASGAGTSKEVMKRFKNQIEYLISEGRQWTMPIISNVEKQMNGLLKRNCGYFILETTDAGGHNGDGFGFGETLERFNEMDIDFGQNKGIIGGGIRKGRDILRALNAGFHAAQEGTSFLTALETNISNFYKELVLNAKPGDVGKIPSPAFFSATGFKNEGIMKKILNGESIQKLKCSTQKGKGCLYSCEGIQMSAELGGIETGVGDYCIQLALRTLNPHFKTYIPGTKEEYPALYFSGMRPEELPFTEIQSAKDIIAQRMLEIHSTLTDGTFKGDGFTGSKITDSMRKALDEKVKYLKDKVGPENLDAKLWRYSNAA